MKLDDVTISRLIIQSYTEKITSLLGPECYGFSFLPEVIV